MPEPELARDPHSQSPCNPSPGGRRAWSDSLRSTSVCPDRSCPSATAARPPWECTTRMGLDVAEAPRRAELVEECEWGYPGRTRRGDPGRPARLRPRARGQYGPRTAVVSRLESEFELPAHEVDVWIARRFGRGSGRGRSPARRLSARLSTRLCPKVASRPTAPGGSIPRPGGVIHLKITPPPRVWCGQGNRRSTRLGRLDARAGTGGGRHLPPGP